MSYHQKYEYIARMIRRAKCPDENEYDYVTRFDRIVFKKWEKGQIDLATCIEEFRKNNAVPNDTYIDPLDFKGWITRELRYKEPVYDK